ncbi:uncharacterized protein [Panulirus ornatus]|uniref:uncharacterized protein n=1 Tax=Panulirus ornatus TaxID=150431 RepID=UPI003A8858CF
MKGTGFMRVASRSQLLFLADKIKTNFPYSFTMYNNLLLHGRGHCRSNNFYVLSNAPESHVLMWQRTDRISQIGVFCQEHEVDLLTKTLRETSLVDWKRPLKVLHVPDYLLGPLQVLAEDLGNSLVTRTYQVFTYSPHLDPEPLRCGPGLRLARLGKAGVQRLLETSRDNRNDPLEPMWRFAQNVPSVGLYTDSNQTKDTLVDPDNLPFAGDQEIPISWTTTSTYGDLGLATTDERHRRRGLMSLVIRAASRLQGRQGYIPHAHVGCDNLASFAVATKMLGCAPTHFSTWMTINANAAQN